MQSSRKDSHLQQLAQEFLSAKDPSSLRKIMWNQYNKDRLIDNQSQKKMHNHTLSFFKGVPTELEKSFHSSKNPIIQFGISDGLYVQKFCKTRNVIGYDFSQTAISSIKNTNITMREVDLNERNSQGTLAYQGWLSEDCNDQVDVLLVRILEFIEPEARQLLMLSLCNLVKPDSRFYIEIFHCAETKLKPDISYSFEVPVKWIKSCFDIWPDFEILHFKTRNSDACNHVDMKNAKFAIEVIARKINSSPYIGNVEGQYNTKIISEAVRSTFIAREKPDCYVDATLDVSEKSQEDKTKISNKLTKYKIPHRLCMFGDKKYFVVPNVNVGENVKDYIHTLKIKKQFESDSINQQDASHLLNEKAFYQM